MEIFDGQNSRGVSFSATTVGLANGSDLEARVLNSIESKLRTLDGAAGRDLSGFDNSWNPAEIRANSTKIQVTMFGIPENQAYLLKSPTFRAALLRYRQVYAAWAGVVPVRNWRVLWTKR